MAKTSVQNCFLLVVSMVTALTLMDIFTSYQPIQTSLRFVTDVYSSLESAAASQSWSTQGGEKLLTSGETSAGRRYTPPLKISVTAKQGTKPIEEKPKPATIQPKPASTVQPKLTSTIQPKPTSTVKPKPTTVPPKSTSTVKPKSATTLKPKPKPKPQRPPCYGGKVPLKSFEKYKNITLPDVTVITAYFNLGSFKKGSGGSFNTGLYMQWAQVYQYLRNPFVFYTDSQEIADKFTKMRQGFENITKILMIKREDVWSFKWRDRIKQIYSIPGYPKHHPNTVVPEYSCVQHGKYAVVEDCVKKDYFKTKYFTWIDLGYFRNVVNRKKPFVITTPPNFNDSMVAMNKVYDVKMDNLPEKIFKGNMVWIGGGMFFGTKYVLPTFIEDYRAAVERYLNMSLSSTDQQVIYAMNTNQEKMVLRQRVPIQKYVADVAGDCWFYLGYSCYKELE